MTEQAYNEAIADLRRWHESDRFQKHFDQIEAHVKALSTLTEVKSLPPPTSILLTRDATGRLHDPTTGQPFTVVIDTLDGRREVTHITFQGERDVPIKLPDPVYVDPEPKAGDETIADVMISDLRENELREAIQRAVEAEDAAKLHALLANANPFVATKVLPPTQELIVTLQHGTAAQLVEVVKAALAPTTIDGLPVVPSDDLLLTTVHPDVSPVTPDDQDAGESADDEDDVPDEGEPTDIATSGEAVPAAAPARKPAKKKRG